MRNEPQSILSAPVKLKLSPSIPQVRRTLQLREADVIYRNRAEIEEAYPYEPGHSIEKVLTDLVAKETLGTTEAELANLLFQTMDAADSGQLFTTNDAKDFIERMNPILQSYLDWLIDMLVAKQIHSANSMKQLKFEAQDMLTKKTQAMADRKEQNVIKGF